MEFFNFYKMATFRWAQSVLREHITERPVIGTIFFTVWLLAEAQPNHPNEVDAVTSATRIPLEWQPISGDWEITGPRDLIQKDPGATPGADPGQNHRSDLLFLNLQCGQEETQRHYPSSIPLSTRGKMALLDHRNPREWPFLPGIRSMAKGHTIDSTIIAYATDPEEWTQIKVFVDGLEGKGYINDIPRLNVSLPRGFPSFGHLVLGSWNTPAEFRNIRVTPEEVAALAGKGLFK